MSVCEGGPELIYAQSIKTDCVNDGSFVFARFVSIGCRLHTR